ncbi:MAG: hypothetical protein JXA14_25775 [Anaerolineae bacterium]|nr:hypothetical protein [Anaerolineae bacterium]
MILLNFAHPLTAEQIAQIETLAGQPVERMIEVDSQVDTQRPLAPQATALADACGLAAEEWQTAVLVVNPPALNFSAVALLAELHGRCGYFPTMLRMRPASGSTPPRFEVAELLNLQAVRDSSRERRTEDKR